MAELTDNPARHRYEMLVDGQTAFVTYELRGDRIALLHTEVPEALSGRGVASTLARLALEDVRRRGLSVIPECAFVGRFIERHPEFGDLVAD